MIKSILKKPFFIVTLAFSLIACILRSFLLKSNIEAQTGFYINPSSLTRIIFVIVLFLSFIFGIVWLYLVKKRGVLPVNLKFDFTKFFSQRIIIALVAIGFAFNSFYELFRISNLANDSLVNKSTPFFAVLALISAIACLAYFIVISLLKENIQFARSLFCVTPIIWIIFRLLKEFVSYATITTVSENLLSIIYLSSLLITFYAFGRILTETDTSKALKIYTILSPIAIILGFILSVPVFIGFAFSFGTAEKSDVFMHIVDFSLSIFLLRASMFIYAEN